MDDAGMTAAVLDSMSLDGEIESLLVTRWQQVCAHAGERLSSRLQPELLAALRLTLLYLSWHGDDASPAQALLRLRRARQRSSAADSRGFAVGGLAPTPRPVPAKRMLLYGCLIVLVPWAWTRISQRLASRRADGAEDTTARRRRLRLMRQIEGGVALASFAVALRYILKSGRAAPTLPMLLVGMELVRSVPSARAPPAFDFMEMQLVWQCLADVMLSARELWQAAPRAVHTPARRTTPSGEDDEAEAMVDDDASASTSPWPLLSRFGHWLRADAEPALTLRNDADEAHGKPHADGAEVDDGLNHQAICVFCGADPPNTPQVAPCGHASCYFCLATARMESRRTTCPQCGVLLRRTRG